MQAKNSSFSSIRLMNVLSGSDTTGLNDQDSRPWISPRLDLAEHLVAIDAGVRQLLLGDAPDVGDVPAMLGVLDVAAAGELVALLAVLAAALAVALAGDRRVAAARPADPPRRQHDVDRRQARC